VRGLGPEGNWFREGPLSFVGRHFDLELGGKPLWM
jgi:hypothetical protein